MNPTHELPFILAALVCTTIAAVHDIRERRIPNRITGPAILLALGMHFFAGGWSQMATSALAGLLAGGLLLLFFLAGGMGAGDVKLMAAVGCFAGLSLLGQVLLITATCGALLGLTLAIVHGRLRETVANSFTLIHHHRYKGLVPHNELNIDNTATLRMPFALPIATACLITATLHLWRA